jgi:hypothetical protein
MNFLGKQKASRCEFCEYQYVNYMNMSGAQLICRASSHIEAVLDICVTNAEYVKVSHAQDSHVHI